MWFALSGIGSYLAHLNVCSGADVLTPVMMSLLSQHLIVTLLLALMV